MATCEIISVGTEILLGDILNTDAQYLSKQLAAMGISVLHQTTVGDNPSRLRDALDAAAKRSDIIITSGGLGPTPDDITKEICCEFFSKKCELNQEILKGIENYFNSKGLKMSANNSKQAELPVDCVIFPNDNGTAPGCAIEKDGKHILMLPGPPRELKPMFKYAAEYLKKFSTKVIVSHSVRTFGIGESVMAQQTEDLLDGENPTVAPYAKDGEALLRVTAMADNNDEAEKLCRPVIDEIKSRLGDYVYGVDEPNIETALVKLLKRKKLKIATAESCTGGMISKRITDVAGASEVFDCGIVSYSNEIKAEVLNVSRDDLKKYGAVSEQVARQMAQGALRVSGADIAISVTGIAGPDSDGTDKPVGLSFIAVAAKDFVKVQKIVTGKAGPGCRDYNRYVTASNALNLARLYINDLLD